MSDANTILMEKIQTVWGTMVADACRTSSVPPGFLAALIAGESAGDNQAKRFEPRVLFLLWEVLLGRKAAYGNIGRADLVAYVTALTPGSTRMADSLPADAFQRIDALAWSWGLTQIMGYHALSDPTRLQRPEANLLTAVRMLTAFAAEFQLDVTKDFSELFRCWNTGQPDGKTFDPAYVNNGLVRMAVWSSLP